MDSHPVQTKKKSKSKKNRKRKANALTQESDFFAENKKIAGFDNPGKSLYNTVRVLLENALDSAESIGELPSVDLTIEEFSESNFSSMIHKEASKGKGKVKEETAATYYMVYCKDNGGGIVDDDIPNMFGQVTQCGVKQRRGKSGLGLKMASIWSKMSTGTTIEVYSSVKNQKYTSVCYLDVDIHGNNPHIISRKRTIQDKKWHGTKIIFAIKGNWTEYGPQILEYMREMAVIAPYAEIMFRFVADTPNNKDMEKRFERRSKAMPKVPKYHPPLMDLELLSQIVKDEATSSDLNLLQFLQRNFYSSVAEARRLVEKMGSVTLETTVDSLTSDQIALMHKLFQEKDEFGDVLSPAGEANLRLGIMREMHPETVATATVIAQAYKGHPLIVEAGVSLGGEEEDDDEEDGEDVEEGSLSVYRFANRAPLVFDEDDDVVTKTVDNINWKRHKISRKMDQIGIFVNIVSTKIPFKEPGMECVGDDTPVIADAVKACLEQCCIKLKSERDYLNQSGGNTLSFPTNYMTEDLMRERLEESIDADLRAEYGSDGEESD